MPTEPAKDGSLVYGYLDTAARHRARAGDAVLVSSPGAAYRAELRPYRFGVLNACEIISDQDVQVRPWRPVGGADRLVAGVVLDGGARLEQDGRQASADPGELVLYTGSRPFRLGIRGPYRYFVVDFEGTALARIADRRVTANIEVSHAPAVRILAATLAELADQASRLDPATCREMGEHIVYLLRTALRGLVLAPTAPDGVYEQVLDYIEEHLADELAPSTIAAAHHVSVRYLHKMFQQRGDTVCAYIRRCRLDHIRRTLADPELAHRSVHSVAARWGFAEASHFGKLFRAEFGVSPGEFRKAALG